ncbi:hypothetical protein FN846DRAFT_1024606 [Sphaerosporella brunnea]|uniref:C2H2-type domain-containing protein n=1 Tax=Sphaerosporella brunnea TaxID=1250544 RepID=A0A5J5EHN6_9PEZI|nr:hypothetical protein FN846DRAFT_1024606 [Sphaerosporella brunnea]
MPRPGPKPAEVDVEALSDEVCMIKEVLQEYFSSVKQDDFAERVSAVPGGVRCPVCSKTFTRQSGFIRHVGQEAKKTRNDGGTKHEEHKALHERLSSLTCEYCGLSFDQRRNLTMHERSCCTYDRTFRCCKRRLTKDSYSAKTQASKAGRGELGVKRLLRCDVSECGEGCLVCWG